MVENKSTELAIAGGILGFGGGLSADALVLGVGVRCRRKRGGEKVRHVIDFWRGRKTVVFAGGYQIDFEGGRRGVCIGYFLCHRVLLIFLRVKKAEYST